MTSDPPTQRHNVILFGATGVGKSSIVNMLRGADKAPTSSSAIGCTLSSTAYAGKISGEAFTFWDTIGLNEGDQGSVPDMAAFSALYQLLRKLEGGVSLLVFCMRGPRVTEIGRKNWALFRDMICQSQVPTVIAITHLEQEDDMGKWWSDNELAFRKYKINPSKTVYRTFDPGSDEEFHSTPGVACITASKGKLKNGHHIFEDEYRISCARIRKLVFESHLPIPWKAEPVEWFQKVVYSMREGWLCPEEVEQVKYVAGPGIFELIKRWGLRDVDEATRIVKVMEEENPE